MAEPMITCPGCKTEIKLTESLAAPILESARRDFELCLAQKDTYMREDLEKEKAELTKQWAKREKQIERIMQSTVGMYGDLQGIAGKTLQEIEGLSFPCAYR